MISERVFARSFADFWTELLPLLTPAFVHLFNTGFREKLVDAYGSVLSPVVREVEGGESSVVSELGFYLARAALERRIGVEAILRNTALKTTCERKTRLRPSSGHSDGRAAEIFPVTDEEWSEALAFLGIMNIFWARNFRMSRFILCHVFLGRIHSFLPGRYSDWINTF